MSVYGGEPAERVPPATTTPAATGWVGVRKPTPAELRAYAASNGWSEDFARNDDATLNQWIADRWDVGRNKFRSYHAPQDAGDWAYVEKPSESVVDPSTGTEWGPWGNQDAVNVTEQKARAAAAPAPATSAIPAASSAPTTPTNPLQQQLIDMFTKGGGYFAEHPGALSLAGGGIVWKDPTETGGTSGPQTGGPDPVPTNLYPQTGGPDPSIPQTGGPDPVPTNLYGTPGTAFTSPSATTPTTPGVNPSLAKATLNAFAPMGAGVWRQAFSQQGRVESLRVCSRRPSRASRSPQHPPPRPRPRSSKISCRGCSRTPRSGGRLRTRE